MEHEKIEKKRMSKYTYMFVVGILFFTLILLIAVTNSDYTPVSNLPVNVNSGVISFDLPIYNATISKGYSDTKFMYNDTLKQWEAHKSIDFLASNGSKVYAVANGEVLDIYTNFLEGTVIVIDHGNGIKSEYGSLSEDVLVEEGDSVEKGQELGTVDNTAATELNTGAHLHFSMYDNDKKVDPNNFLSLASK